jgi:hypothetical protein
MLDTHRIATVAVVALLTVTLASCTSREKSDGISTGSAYIQTPDGSYVPTPAEIAGHTAAPATPTPPAPDTPAPVTPNPASTPRTAPMTFEENAAGVSGSILV